LQPKWLTAAIAAMVDRALPQRRARDPGTAGS